MYERDLFNFNVQVEETIINTIIDYGSVLWKARQIVSEYNVEEFEEVLPQYSYLLKRYHEAYQLLEEYYPDTNRAFMTKEFEDTGKTYPEMYEAIMEYYAPMIYTVLNENLEVQL